MIKTIIGTVLFLFLLYILFAHDPEKSGGHGGHDKDKKKGGH